MSYAIRYTKSARVDLIRLFEFFLLNDVAAALRARDWSPKATG